MRPAHVRERPIGIRYYASTSPGIGGYIKGEPADFRVIEQPGLETEAIDADPGDYPYLVVEVTATERDTHDITATLADEMGIHPEQIGFAGTKDANAVTTQWMTLNKVVPNELIDLPGVEVRAIGRLGRQLEFGDHAGNRFEIVVRDVTDPDRIDRIHQELSIDDGRVRVPNFFGLQRFGTRRTITHTIGRSLLAGDTEEAVMTYLTETSPHEPPRTRDARASIASALDAGDPATALEATPGYLHHERRMLEVLDEEGLDAVDAALDALPWSLQRLFINAVQSHAFNEIVSERMRRGLPLAEPIEGDAICFLDDGEIDPSTMQPVTASRLRTARRHCERGRAEVVGPLIGSETPTLDGIPGAIADAVMAGLDIDRQLFATNQIYESTGTWRQLSCETDLEIDLDPPTFSFALQPGSYATVVLREFLKTDPLRMI